VGARPTSTGQTVAHLVDNGKRVLDIDLREWAYARPYLSSAQREAALQPFLHRYNWHRPHYALNHLPRISRTPAMSNLLELNS
jgi:transposase InsO family protein